MGAGSTFASYDLFKRSSHRSLSRSLLLGRHLGVLSAFRPCGRDLVEFFNSTGRAFYIQVWCQCGCRMLADLFPTSRFWGQLHCWPTICPELLDWLHTDEVCRLGSGTLDSLLSPNPILVATPTSAMLGLLILRSQAHSVVGSWFSWPEPSNGHYRSEERRVGKECR